MPLRRFSGQTGSGIDLVQLRLTGCPHRGCLRAQISAHRLDAHVRLRLDRPFPVAVRAILGCPGDPAPLLNASLALARGGTVHGARFHHVLVTIPAGQAGPLTAPTPGGARLWFEPPPVCTRLQVLDLAPLARPGRRPRARIWL